MKKTIYLRQYSEERQPAFLDRVKTTIQYASPSTKFYVGGKETLAIIRKAGFTVQIGVLAVEEN